MCPAHLNRVLLVDDDYFVRDLISTAFSGKGCEIFHARSGSEAYAIFLQQKPDVVISDIVMPEGDGLEFCRRIRREGHRTPFVFLTQLKDFSDVNAALAAGADAYFEKPVHPGDFLRRLTELISQVPPQPQPTP